MRASTRRAGWLALVAVGVVAFALALLPGVATLVPVEGLVARVGNDYFLLGAFGGVATLVPVEGLVARVGNDYFLLGAFGGVALAVLVWMLARRATGQVEQAAPPDPETVPDAPRPGERLDDLLARWPWELSGSERDYLRERLRAAAVYDELGDGRSRAAARARVESGDWTDDPVATRFLAADSSGPALTERVRLALRGDAWAQHGARATARELADGGASSNARRTSSDRRSDGGDSR